MPQNAKTHDCLQNESFPEYSEVKELAPEYFVVVVSQRWARPECEKSEYANTTVKTVWVFSSTHREGLNSRVFSSGIRPVIVSSDSEKKK